MLLSIIKKVPKGLVASTSPITTTVEQQLQIIVRHSPHCIPRHLQPAAAGSEDVVEGIQSGDCRRGCLGRLHRNLLPLGRGSLLGRLGGAGSLRLGADPPPQDPGGRDDSAPAIPSSTPAAAAAADARSELRRQSRKRAVEPIAKPPRPDRATASPATADSSLGSRARAPALLLDRRRGGEGSGYGGSGEGRRSLRTTGDFKVEVKGVRIVEIEPVSSEILERYAAHGERRSHRKLLGVRTLLPLLPFRALGWRGGENIGEALCLSGFFRTRFFRGLHPLDHLLFRRLRGHDRQRDVVVLVLRRSELRQ
mmetsp:Transcript_13859/g.54947  ORF Transcript_13859/g.54947 Transcript_13859/m.54947 type:complete len:309 (-) Transcript_13859:82-1008(-)